jgi:DNA-binding SARP family transcriptional activator
VGRLVASYLGGCSLSTDGAAVALGSRRTDALFAYLAHTGATHTREHLAELLWEPGNPTRSAGNLRVLLTNLRRQAGAFVDITRTTVAFNGGPDTWVDSRAVLDMAEKALATQGSDDRDGLDESTLATLRDASAMCRGEFLSHLDLHDATRFDDWLRDERARLHGLRGQVLPRLVELELGTGDFASALQDAGLLIRVEPWQEKSHQLMIRARRATGDDAGALKHFEMFDAQHRAEFGTPAGRATRDLVSDLVHHDGPVPTSRTAATTERTGAREARRRQPWSRFSSRRPELGTIISRYAEAAAGRGNVVIVRGASGTGKTTLVRRAVNVLVERDPAVVVLGGSGDDVARSGTGDLLVDNLLAQREGVTTGGWLDGPMSPSVVERVRALASFRKPEEDDAVSPLVQLVRVVRDLARRQPVLLVIDDFQWTAPTTRNLVAELARGINTIPLFLLIATQSGRGVGPAHGVGSPSWLLDRVGETAGRVLVDLDEADSGDRGRHFVEQMLDTERHALPERLVAEVERLGAGHPLVTVELLRDLVRRGQVAPDRTGKLVLVGQVSWPTLPDRLVRLLEGQVADLPEDVASLLEAAAAHGPTFDFRVAALALGRPVPETARVFGRTLGGRGQGLVQALADSDGPRGHTHRFRHPVLREHLLSRMDPHERRLLDKLVADAAGPS